MKQRNPKRDRTKTEGYLRMIGLCVIGLWHEKELIVYHISIPPDHQSKGMGAS
ncbi:MAG: hypothetical protein JW776_01315 [Candidatus Lokiarchaeota archaeon]|nr:hypothetical protein [Candidatus Lokiarchaeota archaeon]